MVWFKHKGVRHGTKQPHYHPSHPYEHPAGRWHHNGPASRIRDRKGRAFRHTPQELRRQHVVTKYTDRRGKRRIWD